MPGRPNSQDKTRYCPYCRMEISVFATKCFHCGERVDPPRTDQRHFSMEDLGGRTGTNYAPSESVMTALEMFRAELSGKIEAEKSSQSSDPGAEASGSGGLPTLDERSRVLASLHEESRPTGAFAQVYVPPQPSLIRRIATILAVVIVIAVVGSVGVGLYRMMQEREPATPVENKPPMPPNHAPKLLAEGKLFDALNEARDAVVLNPTEENTEIQTAVREAIAAKVQEHLTANPWKPEDLERAVELATQAAIIDPSEFFTRLEREVKEEEYAYKMMLVRPEQEGLGGKARFRLNALSRAAVDSGKEFVTVETGEEFAGRFKLLGVGRREAVVEDTLRDRRIVYNVTGSFAAAQ